MDRCTLRGIAAVALIAGYMAAAAVGAAYAWLPGRAWGVLVESPRGSIVGAGVWEGERWAAVSGDWGTTLLLESSTANLTGLRAGAACATPWGLAVAGSLGRDRVLYLAGWDGSARMATVRVAAQPRSCSYSSGVLAVLLSHPVLRSYLLVYRGGDTAVLIGLSPRAAPSQPVSVQVLDGSTVLVGGRGYYLLVELQGEGAPRGRASAVRLGGDPVTVTGGTLLGGGVAVYGYAGNTGNYTGLLRLPGHGWLALRASSGGQTRVHAGLSPYPGWLRLAVEVVGRETLIVDVNSGRVAGARKLVVLAPYIFHYARPEAGMMLVAGDVFIGGTRDGARRSMALLLGSNSAVDVGVNETMVLALLGRGSAVWLEPAVVEERPRSGPVGLPVEEVSLGPGVQAKHGVSRALWMGALVDRRVLACAGLAALMAFSAPLAGAVYSYTVRPCREDEGVGRRA